MGEISQSITSLLNRHKVLEENWLGDIVLSSGSGEAETDCDTQASLNS